MINTTILNAVCLATFSDISNNNISQLQCGHKFCEDCIKVLKKVNKDDKYVCPSCKTANVLMYIIDNNNRLKQFHNIRPSITNYADHKCQKCLNVLKDKYYISCVSCSLFFHADCIKNFSDDVMKKNITFICPKCIVVNFNDNIMTCSSCNSYTTKQKIQFAKTPTHV